jgi:microcin C transport system permease protein
MVNKSKKIGIVFVILGILSGIGECCELELPSLSYLFKINTLLGWIGCGLLILTGILMVLGCFFNLSWSPQATERWVRFKKFKRGWYSLWVLVFLVLLACLDQLIVGRRALIVEYEGKWYFPALEKKRYVEKDFDREGTTEVNYRKLKEHFDQTQKGWVVMPLVPWDSTLDSDTELEYELIEENGRYKEADNGKLFSGYGISYYEGGNEKYMQVRMRQGQYDGTMKLFDRDGSMIAQRQYQQGQIQKETIYNNAVMEKKKEVKSTALKEKRYAPFAPAWKARHYLGTDSKGWDILAHLYGGWQINLQAAMFYVILIYSIGLLIGMTMGYFGGAVDIIVQRVIEIIESIPFLYVIMLLMATIKVANVQLWMVVMVYSLFGWMGLTYPIRALAYKEKEREYVLAARLQGASHWRIMWGYLLPNMIATLVTYLPFTVAALISSLTALSYLGFGLPPQYASWGWLIDDGTHYLSSGWISYSVIGAMIVILLLVNFVGEALREAFDPKKFSTYR